MYIPSGRYTSFLLDVLTFFRASFRRACIHVGKRLSGAIKFSHDRLIECHILCQKHYRPSICVFLVPSTMLANGYRVQIPEYEILTKFRKIQANGTKFQFFILNKLPPNENQNISWKIVKFSLFLNFIFFVQVRVSYLKLEKFSLSLCSAQLSSANEPKANQLLVFLLLCEINFFFFHSLPFWLKIIIINNRK